MESFRYKAMDKSGHFQYGHIDAINLADLEMHLRRMNLDLINYKVITKDFSKYAKGGIKRRDLNLFCFHMEQTLRASVPIIESLEDFAESVDNMRFAEVISGIIEAIEGGKTLSQAMQLFPKIFDQVMVSLIKAGEESGELSQIFRRLDEDIKWQDEQIEQTKKLLRYPMFVGGVVVTVVFFLMIYLVPELLSFVQSMGEQAPLQTKVLLMVSNFFVAFWGIILGAIVALIIFFYMGGELSPTIRYKIDKLKLHLPVTGVILKKIILTRLMNTFAIMYHSGISITGALKSMETLSGNKVMDKAVAEICQRIIEGFSLTDSFSKAELFPPLVIRMIRVGEHTGNLYEGLLNVSYFYARDVKNSIDRLQSMIEPTMIFILSIIIFWIIISVLGPIYELISEINF